MKNATTLEELVKKYLKDSPLIGKADTYDLYKHKSNLGGAKAYSDAVASLYLKAKESLPTFGQNSRKISNNGLQNSGYSAYVGSLAKQNFNQGLSSLNKTFSDNEAKARSSYASYLDTYLNKKKSVARSVMTHLIDNDVTDITTATAYGMSAGLSKEDAEAIGKSAYEVTRQKLFNKILEQSASLGLDKDGAKLLAMKMGISETDADSLAQEVNELLKYYKNISEDYLDFLEERAN